MDAENLLGPVDDVLAECGGRLRGQRSVPDALGEALVDVDSGLFALGHKLVVELEQDGVLHGLRGVGRQVGVLLDDVGEGLRAVDAVALERIGQVGDIPLGERLHDERRVANPDGAVSDALCEHLGHAESERLHLGRQSLHGSVYAVRDERHGLVDSDLAVLDSEGQRGCDAAAIAGHGVGQPLERAGDALCGIVHILDAVRQVLRVLGGLLLGLCRLVEVLLLLGCRGRALPHGLGLLLGDLSGCRVVLDVQLDPLVVLREPLVVCVGGLLDLDGRAGLLLEVLCRDLGVRLLLGVQLPRVGIGLQSIGTLGDGAGHRIGHADGVARDVVVALHGRGELLLLVLVQLGL